MSIILTQVEIKHFRSVCETKPLAVKLETGLNILVGPTNSGKSNVLQAIALALEAERTGCFDPARDVPAQLAWARPSITLQFQVERPTPSEKTLLSLAQDYERSIEAPDAKTNAERGVLRLRVKYQGDARQEYLAIGGAGDRRGSAELNEKAVAQLRKCVRFIYIRSGEDVQGLLAGRFDEVLRSVLEERMRGEFDVAHQRREEFVKELQAGLLDGLTKALSEEIRQIVPESVEVALTPRIPTIEEMLANASVALKDAAMTDLVAKGTGVRGGLLVAMLKYLADQSKQSLVFAVEEPESFLHPGAQQEVMHDLETLAGRRDVTLLTTSHSPFMSSRFAGTKVMALAKDKAGATYLRAEAMGNGSHLDAMSGLYRDSVLPNLLETAAAIPAGARCVLVVEGYSDKFYLETAAAVAGRVELLSGIAIVPADGASSACVSAIVWRARETLPVLVMLDWDEPGKKARERLVKDYRFDGNDVLTYRDALDPRAEGVVEAEDLFTNEFVKGFLETEVEEDILSETSKTGSRWHFGLTQKGKERFMVHVKRKATADDVSRLVVVLERVHQWMQERDNRAKAKLDWAKKAAAPGAPMRDN